MAQSPVSDFYRLLSLCEDYIESGFEKETIPVSVTESFEDSLEAIGCEVSSCTLCGLSRARKKAVPGFGSASPLVLVIGEAPGAEEDEEGLPFVGAAGQYLDKWLKAIELDRGTNAYIANVVKCRPPQNRDPLPEETSACLPFLRRQIEILKPRAILCLGRISSQLLSGRTEGIGRLRGRAHSYGDIPVSSPTTPALYSAIPRSTGPLSGMT
jgi:DNA polymerase